jgi:hypothetical protein
VKAEDRRCEYEHCGEVLPATATVRRHFCNDRCKMAYHRAAKRGAGGRDATPDRLVIKFRGAVTLNPSDPRDAELFRRVALGQGGLSLQIEGRCSKYEQSYTSDRWGEPVGVKQEANVTVKTVSDQSDAE